MFGASNREANGTDAELWDTSVFVRKNSDGDSHCSKSDWNV